MDPNESSSGDGKDDATRYTDDPVSTLEKFLLLFGGVAAPVFTHLIVVQSFGGSGWLGGPRYQTGLLKDKLAFLFSFDALALMYPLIIFSMIALATTVVEVRYTGKTFWARFGLLTGIPIGVAYHLVFLSQTGFRVSEVIVFHLIPIVTVLLIWGGSKLLLAWTRDRRAAWLSGLTILFGLSTFVSVIRVIVTGDHSNWALIAFPFFALLYGVFLYGPLIWLGCFSWTIARVVSVHPGTRQFSLAGMMCWVTWLGVFFAACRHAVIRSLEAYSRLPTTDPGNCYVATAACRGHQRLVRSSDSECGYTFNQQLQTLKALELALQTLTPDLHRRLRRVYDVVGAKIAGRLRARWAADLTYLSLKPIEWAAALALRLMLGRRYRLIRTLFR